MMYENDGRFALALAVGNSLSPIATLMSSHQTLSANSP